MAEGPPEWPLKILRLGVATTQWSPLSLSGDLFFALAGSRPLPSNQRAGSGEATSPGVFPFAKQAEQSPPSLQFGPFFIKKKGLLTTYAEWTGVVILPVENLTV